MRPSLWRGLSSAAMCWVLLGLMVLTSRGVAMAGTGEQIQVPDGVVRAILFYSPTCPHCHVVIDEVLPPLRSRHGADLVIVELDTTSSEGREIWRAAVALYNPPTVGVPTLIIGEHVLIGSRQIPEFLPGLIQEYLAEGGVAWPALPGLDALVVTLEPADAGGALDEVLARFGRDPVGNTLAVVVLAVLLATLVAVIKPRPWQVVWSKRAGLWVLAPLVLGLGVSLYLARIETSGMAAVCGPVGDCNAVQQSSFALLFGFLPVAVLGVMGYAAILLTYGLWLLTQISLKRYLPGAIFIMAFFGLGFATYLTFLEPFVIGATCLWCLTQSLCIAAVALLAAGPGWPSLREAVQGGGLLKKPAV